MTKMQRFLCQRTKFTKTIHKI